jgi:hypothetical protein
MAKDLRFQESNSGSPLDHGSHRLQLGGSHWSHKIHADINGAESLIGIQGSSKGDPHCRVCQQGQDPTVDGPHWIVVPLVNDQSNRGFAQGFVWFDDHSD